MESVGKILALDIGEKRVGYAVSDPGAELAFPRGSFAARPKAKFLIELKEVVREEGVSKMVIGIPLDDDNREGTAAKKVRTFGELLARLTMLPIEYVDEWGTTDEALAKIPFRKDRRAKGSRDAIAAQIILQRYLDAKRE